MDPIICDIQGIRAVLSTRHGGVSEGGFASLNLGYHVGDDPARVSENRLRLASAAGYDAAALVCGRQVHGTALAWVGEEMRGRGAFAWDDALPDTDGLLTDVPGLPLAILVADCAPVLIADPVGRRLAVVHAGWRGAVGRIASSAARELVAAGSRAGDLRAVIGPTLCPACFEIGPEVAALASPFGDVVVTGYGKPHLDVIALLRADLAAAGVQDVAAHPACTRCEAETFFSHRASGGTAGRFALVAWVGVVE